MAQRVAGIMFLDWQASVSDFISVQFHSMQRWKWQLCRSGRSGPVHPVGEQVRIAGVSRFSGDKRAVLLLQV